MQLPSYGVRLPHPCPDIVVHILGRAQFEVMHLVALGDALDLREARVLEPPRQNDVRVQVVRN
jgi:hypothetical protein